MAYRSRYKNKSDGGKLSSKPARPKASAFECAAKKLDSRPLTVFEMKQYLKQRDYSPEEIQQAVDSLVDYKYLDDSAYCETFFRYAAGKNWSWRRIRTELAIRGVDTNMAEILWEDFADSAGVREIELARAEAEKVLRLADLGPEDAVPDRVRARIARRLAARGFSAGIIYDVLGEFPYPEKEFDD